MDEKDYKEEIIEDSNNEVVENKEKEVPKLSIKNQFKTSKGRVRFITRVSMFSALSFVFYAFLKFPLPFFPSFLEINFSNLFIIIGSLLTGPIGGVIIAVIRFLLKMPLSHTAYIGELTELLLYLCIMLPASLFYTFNHTKKGGMIGLIFSFIAWILSSVLINHFISLPFYTKFYFNGNIDGIVSLLKATIPNATVDNYRMLYIFVAVIPFNLINGFINCGLAFLVYKKISTVLKRMGI